MIYGAQSNGNNDFERAKWSYNNAERTLNEKANEYLNDDGIAIRARIVGTIPNDPDNPDNNDDESMFIIFYNRQDWKFRNSDSNAHKMDYEQLSSLDLLQCNNELNEGIPYWYASRSYSGTLDVINNKKYSKKYLWFSYIANNAKKQSTYFCWVYDYGMTSGINDDNLTYGLRPVFILNPNVKVKSGTGTLENPYELILI